jgi:prepilin signal peptidase PulO-like enzyme (type II secretory pathway)
LNPFSGGAGAILFALLGLVGGSFATAASHRLPLDRPIAMDRSRCASCGHTLGAADLVPVLSWIVTRGRCRYCGTRVSARYPLIEIVTMIVFVAAWWLGQADIVIAALLALTGLGLVIIVVADLEARIIPDKVLMAMIPLAILWRWRTQGDWVDGVAGMVIGFGVMYGLRAAFKALRGVDALGLGDVKFLGLAGFYVGVSGLPPLLVLGGLIGIVFGLVWRAVGKGAAFPFGPALCVALAALLAAPQWMSIWPPA